MVTQLSKTQLLEFINLSKKVKDKYLAIRLSEEERKRYEELAAKHGQPVSTLARETLFKSLYHFKGIKHEKRD